MKPETGEKLENLAQELDTKVRLITSDCICKLLIEIGFTIEHNYGRVVDGLLPLNDDKKHVFILQVDVELNTFGLICSSELIRQTIIKQQSFDSTDDLKAMLLKNKVFTHYCLGSG